MYFIFPGKAVKYSGRLPATNTGPVRGPETVGTQCKLSFGCLKQDVKSKKNIDESLTACNLNHNQRVRIISRLVMTTYKMIEFSLFVHFVFVLTI